MKTKPPRPANAGPRARWRALRVSLRERFPRFARRISKRPSGWEGLCPVGIAPPLSREKQRQRKKTSAPRPPAWGRSASETPVFVLTWLLRPHAGGRGVWGVGSPFKRLANSDSPAPRGECERSPQSRLNCASPLGAGALGRALRFSNARNWDSHSRARFGRALLLPKSCPSLCHRARVAVCGVFVCRRCVLRVSNGLPARSGATRAAKPPKTERGTFRVD